MLIKALFWSGFGAVTNMAVQFGLLAVMSRLLAAPDFGLMASAAFALRFVSYFVQFGLGPALIQRKELEPEHAVAALISGAVIGSGTWALVAVLAPLASGYFREAQLVPVLQVLPVVLGLGAVASVPQALLRRGMRFRLLALIEFLALALGYGLVGVWMALNQYGVWSLVGALIGQQVVLLVLCLAVTKLPLLRPKRRHFVDLGGYGGSYSFVGFVEFLSCNLETLFIGRYLGSSRLGEFNRAQAVTSLPVDQFMGAINRVMFPALSSLNGDPVAMARALLISLKLSALITFPLAVGISMASHSLVAVALGSAWAGVVPAAILLAWSIPAAYLSTFIGMTFDGLGQFRRKLALILTITLLKIALMALVGQQGLIAVIQAMLVAEWVRVLLGLALLRRILPIPWFALAVVLGRGVAAASVVGVGMWLFRQVLPPVSPFVELLALGLVASALLLPTFRHLLRAVVRESEAAGADLAPLRRLARI